MIKLDHGSVEPTVFVMSCFLLGSFSPISRLPLFRFVCDGQAALQYCQNPSEGSSTHSSPYKTLPRPPRDPRSMPATPVMTRNAYSSSQLRCAIRLSRMANKKKIIFLFEIPFYKSILNTIFFNCSLSRSEASSHCFRHRSGSLESQHQLGADMDPEKPVFILSSHHSNSTEVLENCSSYTSQSSLECCGAANSHYNTIDSRTSTMHHLRRKVEVYGNTGSMPNLVQHHPGYNYSSDTSTNYAPSAYYVTGYPCPDMDPYTNGSCVYESDVEGRYNVNPNYQMNGCHGYSRFRHYNSDGADSLSQNPYATVRPPRSREGPRNDLLAKNMQKALVAEHLRGWYHRHRGHREDGRGPMVGYDFDNSTQLGYQTMPAGFSHSSRTTSYSSGGLIFSCI